MTRFENRRAAGRLLGELLAPARERAPLVLGIPRGGVLAADEVARALGAPLDVLVTRRLVSPHDPSLVLGAVAETGAVWLNALGLMHAGVRESELSEPIMRETLEVQRQARRYREGRSRFNLGGRTVLLVDDGLVTGATARAALLALRALGAERIVLAVGMADDTIGSLRPPLVDAIAVGHRVAELGALDRWYGDFAPVTDGEVLAVLARRREEAERALDSAVP